MDRKTATLAGAAAALIASSVAAQAAPSEGQGVPLASSYDELLEPIPNATQRLKIADAQDAALRAKLETVQFGFQFGVPHRHHHHHSSDWYVRNGYMWDGDQGRWVPQDFYNYHHHHHHHHHHSNYNDYYNW